MKMDYRKSWENKTTDVNVEKQLDEIKKDILKVFEYIEKEVLNYLINQNVLIRFYLLPKTFLEQSKKC